jgi:hypothetical protein
VGLGLKCTTTSSWVVTAMYEGPEADLADGVQLGRVCVKLTANGAVFRHPMHINRVPLRRAARVACIPNPACFAPLPYPTRRHMSLAVTATVRLSGRVPVVANPECHLTSCVCNFYYVVGFRLRNALYRVIADFHLKADTHSIRQIKVTGVSVGRCINR